MSDPLSIEMTEEGIEVRPLAVEPQSDTSQVETLPLQSYLNLEHPTSRELTQVREVWDYLADKANGVGDLLYQFRQLEARMSPPKLGETRLAKIYNYVNLQKQITEAEQQRDSL